jgi:hypothetical protein
MANEFPRSEIAFEIYSKAIVWLSSHSVGKQKGDEKIDRAHTMGNRFGTGNCKME